MNNIISLDIKEKLFFMRAYSIYASFVSPILRESVWENDIICSKKNICHKLKFLSSEFFFNFLNYELKNTTNNNNSAVRGLEQQESMNV